MPVAEQTNRRSLDRRFFLVPGASDGHGIHAMSRHASSKTSDVLIRFERLITRWSSFLGFELLFVPLEATQPER